MPRYRVRAMFEVCVFDPELDEVMGKPERFTSYKAARDRAEQLDQDSPHGTVRIWCEDSSRWITV
jgi:hypothetical protein